MRPAEAFWWRSHDSGWVRVGISGSGLFWAVECRGRRRVREPAMTPLRMSTGRASGGAGVRQRVVGDERAEVVSNAGFTRRAVEVTRATRVAEWRDSEGAVVTQAGKTKSKGSTLIVPDAA